MFRPAQIFMTSDQFIAKYNQVPVDFDKAFGNQCMDLMHQYCLDVLGLDGSILRAPDAQTVFKKFSWPKQFMLVPNTPTGVPSKGDIIFFSTPPSGHVAIFFDGDAKQFTSFDQNWPLNSLPHLQRHDYKEVLGWLRRIS